MSGNFNCSDYIPMLKYGGIKRKEENQTALGEPSGFLPVFLCADGRHSGRIYGAYEESREVRKSIAEGIYSPTEGRRHSVNSAGKRFG